MMRRAGIFSRGDPATAHKKRCGEAAAARLHSMRRPDRKLHKAARFDPFDRLLIAQAIAEPLRLLTVDEMLTKYSDVVHLV